MAELYATFPAGVTRQTVHGLYQWDKNVPLHISSDLLDPLHSVEVHFAHAGMKDAIRQDCQISDQGVIFARVPDVCLVQSSPIFAWVYIPSGAASYTILEITMPVHPRVMPADALTELPAEDYDKYGALYNKASELQAAAVELFLHYYTKTEIDAALGKYITELNTLVGGEG